MPIGYGSRFELSKLSSNAVASRFHETKDWGDAWSSLLKLFITFGEVAVTMIPGVGLIAGTGIAMLGAAGRTAVDIEAGNPISATTLGLDIASGILPGVLHGLKAGMTAFRESRIVTESVTNLGVGVVKREGTIFNMIDHSKIDAGISAAFKGDKLAGKLDLDMMNNLATVDTLTGSVKNLKGFFHTVQNEMGHLIKDPNSILGSIWSEYLDKYTEHLISIGVQKAGTAAIEASTYRYQQLERDLKLWGLTDIEISEMLRIASLAINSKNKMIAFYRYLTSIRNAEDVQKMLIGIAGSYSRKINIARIAKKSIEAANKEKRWASKQMAKYVKAIKKPGGADFNDMIVQPVQAIFDPSDLGRAPIEMFYKELKNSIKFESKLIKKMIKKGAKIEEIFTKGGGVLVNSDVILGYKVLNEEGLFNLIQISFKPSATAAKHKMWNGKISNNYGGKKPVYVQASKLDIKRLTVGGMRYYQKRWAMSKGGAVLGAGAFGLGGLISESNVLLPFINTGLLRNILSLTSNIVSNVGKMVDGKWANTWVKKFKGSFIRNIQGRAGRLTGRVILGGLAGKFFGKQIGVIIGKESQRILSTVTKSLVTAEHKKVGSFASNFSKAFNSQYKKRIMTAVTHYAKRASRRNNPNNAVIAGMGVNRKLGFIRRIPSSVGVKAQNKWKFKIA